MSLKILLKRTTRKIISQEEEFLKFCRPLITAGLPLIKCVHMLLAKCVLLPFELTAAVSATDATN